MSLTRRILNLRPVVLVLAVLLAVMGLYSYQTLPKESNPSIDIPVYNITTRYPGASPQEVADLVTRPLEEELQGAEGIEEISSTSRQGFSNLRVEFGTNVPLTQADQRVRERVDRAAAELPANAEPPLVEEINFDDLPVITVNLTAPYSLARLRQVGEELQDRLERISSVLEADLRGGLQREVRIEVDRRALQAYGLTFQDVARAVAREHTSIAGGQIETDRLRYLVRVDGRFDDPSRLADLVVAAPGDRPIYVRDVAEVLPVAYKDRESYARLRVLRRETPEGELREAEDRGYTQAISLAVRKRSGANVIETVNAVEDAVGDFALPRGTRVTYTGDRRENVTKLVAELENNIVLGVVLITLTLLVFLGLRPALLVGLTVPLSIFTAMIVFLAMDQALNFIVLFSLIIALGLLVDASLIIVENIRRHREDGRSVWDAVGAATTEIGRPIAAGTATTCAIFVPMLFWSGRTGEFLRFIPLTLIIVLGSALFIALVITPTLAGYLLAGEQRDGPSAGAGPDDADAGREWGWIAPEEWAARSAPARPEWALQREPADARPRSPWFRRLALAVLVAGALVLLLANWITFLVVAGLVVAFWLLHRFALAPASRWMRRRGLPRLIEHYRHGLDRALERDYDVRWSYWRNVTALALFTAGAAVLLLGGLVMLLAGRQPALVLLAPGALLAGLGALGIVLHAAETALAGRWTTVAVGLALSGVLALFLVPRALGGGLPWPRAIPLLLPGAVIALLGAAGVLLLGERRWLVLTDNRARTLTTALAAFAGVAGLYLLAPTGTSFFPETDPRQIRIGISAPVGTRAEATDDLAARVLARLDSLMRADSLVERNVKNVVAGVGVTGSGLGSTLVPRPERGQITINLVDYAERVESSTETIRKVRQTVADFIGADLWVEQDEQGPRVEPPVNIEIEGENYEQIARIAQDVERRLQRAVRTGEVPGLVSAYSDLELGQPELQVRVDRERAALAGLSTEQIGAAVRAAVQGTVAATYRVGDDDYDITVRLKDGDRGAPERLQSLPIGRVDARGATPPAASGSQGPVAASASSSPVPNAGADAPGAPSPLVPLASVAELEVERGLGAVTRLDLESTITVSGEAGPGYTGPEVLQAAQEYLAGIRDSLPTTVELRYTGQQEEQQSNFRFLGIAGAAGAGLLLLVMVAQFNGILPPLMIAVAMGLSLGGAVFALVLSRLPFSLFVFLGIVSLIGIVADDDIVVHEFISRARAEGMTKREAILEACTTRFRQVVLTSLTTIIGLVPLTFGIVIDFVGLLTAFEPGFQLGTENSQFWGPLGTALLGGLPAATLVTLVVTPVLYSAVDSLRVRIAAAWARGQRAPQPAPAAGD